MAERGSAGERGPGDGRREARLRCELARGLAHAVRLSFPARVFVNVSGQLEFNVDHLYQMAIPVEQMVLRRIGPATPGGQGCLAWEAEQGVQEEVEAGVVHRYQVSQVCEAVCLQVLRAQDFVHVTGRLSFNIDNCSVVRMSLSHMVLSSSDNALSPVDTAASPLTEEPGHVLLTKMESPDSQNSQQPTVTPVSAQSQAGKYLQFDVDVPTFPANKPEFCSNYAEKRRRMMTFARTTQVQQHTTSRSSLIRQTDSSPAAESSPMADNRMNWETDTVGDSGISEPWHSERSLFSPLRGSPSVHQHQPANLGVFSPPQEHTVCCVEPLPHTLGLDNEEETVHRQDSSGAEIEVVCLTSDSSPNSQNGWEPMQSPMQSLTSDVEDKDEYWSKECKPATAPKVLLDVQSSQQGLLNYTANVPRNIHLPVRGSCPVGGPTKTAAVDNTVPANPRRKISVTRRFLQRHSTPVPQNVTKTSSQCASGRGNKTNKISLLSSSEDSSEAWNPFVSVANNDIQSDLEAGDLHVCQDTKTDNIPENVGGDYDNDDDSEAIGDGIYDIDKDSLADYGLKITGRFPVISASELSEKGSRCDDSLNNQSLTAESGDDINLQEIDVEHDDESNGTKVHDRAEDITLVTAQTDETDCQVDVSHCDMVTVEGHCSRTVKEKGKYSSRNYSEKNSTSPKTNKDLNVQVHKENDDGDIEFPKIYNPYSLGTNIQCPDCSFTTTLRGLYQYHRLKQHSVWKKQLLEHQLIEAEDIAESLDEDLLTRDERDGTSVCSPERQTTFKVSSPKYGPTYVTVTQGRCTIRYHINSKASRCVADTMDKICSLPEACKGLVKACEVQLSRLGGNFKTQLPVLGCSVSISKSVFDNISESGFDDLLSAHPELLQSENTSTPKTTGIPSEDQKTITKLTEETPQNKRRRIRRKILRSQKKRTIQRYRVPSVLSESTTDEEENKTRSLNTSAQFSRPNPKQKSRNQLHFGYPRGILPGPFSRTVFSQRSENQLRIGATKHKECSKRQFSDSDSLSGYSDSCDYKTDISKDRSLQSTMPFLRPHGFDSPANHSKNCITEAESVKDKSCRTNVVCLNDCIDMKEYTIKQEFQDETFPNERIQNHGTTIFESDVSCDIEIPYDSSTLGGSSLRPKEENQKVSTNDHVTEKDPEILNMIKGNKIPRVERDGHHTAKRVLSNKSKTIEHYGQLSDHKEENVDRHTNQPLIKPKKDPTTVRKTIGTLKINRSEKANSLKLPKRKEPLDSEQETDDVNNTLHLILPDEDLALPALKGKRTKKSRDKSSMNGVSGPDGSEGEDPNTISLLNQSIVRVTDIERSSSDPCKLAQFSNTALSDSDHDKEGHLIITDVSDNPAQIESRNIGSEYISEVTAHRSAIENITVNTDENETILYCDEEGTINGVNESVVEVGREDIDIDESVLHDDRCETPAIGGSSVISREEEGTSEDSDDQSMDTSNTNDTSKAEQKVSDNHSKFQAGNIIFHFRVKKKNVTHSHRAIEGSIEGNKSGITNSNVCHDIVKDEELIQMDLTRNSEEQQIKERRSTKNAEHQINMRETQSDIREGNEELKYNNGRCRTNTFESHRDDFGRFCCLNCSYKSPDAKMYINHVQEYHSSKKQYQCNVCGLVCTKSNIFKWHLYKHLKQHKEKNVDKCQRQCNPKITYDNRERKRSKSRHHPIVKQELSVSKEQNNTVKARGRILKCPFCSTDGFRTKKALRLHKESIHPSKKKGGNSQTVTCGICYKKIGSQEMVQEHVLTVHPFSCVICKETFPDQISLTDHKVSVHQSSHKCWECGREYQTALSLSTHKRMFHGLGQELPKPPSEGIVAQSSDNPVDKSHDITVDPPHLNPSAGLMDISEDISTSQSEERTRSSCYVCLSSFNSRKILKAHLRKHNIIFKRHMCVRCGQQFAQNEQLEKHMVKKHSDQLYKCSICKLVCGTALELASHKKIHVESKTCRYCEKVLISEWHKNRHEKWHENHQFLKCDICQVAFKNAYTLMQHNISKHPKKNYHLKNHTSTEISDRGPSSILSSKCLFQKSNDQKDTVEHSDEPQMVRSELEDLLSVLPDEDPLNSSGISEMFVNLGESSMMLFQSGEETQIEEESQETTKDDMLSSLPDTQESHSVLPDIEK